MKRERSCESANLCACAVKLNSSTLEPPDTLQSERNGSNVKESPMSGMRGRLRPAYCVVISLRVDTLFLFLSRSRKVRAYAAADIIQFSDKKTAGQRGTLDVDVSNARARTRHPPLAPISRPFLPLFPAPPFLFLYRTCVRTAHIIIRSARVCVELSSDCYARDDAASESSE